MNNYPTECSNPLENSIPFKLLGLPDPATIELEDSRLLKIYRDFCACLYIGLSEDVVMADAEFFHFDSRSVDGNPDVMTKLKLLCALLRPTKSYLKQILARTYDTESFRNSQGRFTGHVYSFGIGMAIRCLEEFRETADYKTLQKPSIPFKYIDCLSSEMPSAPGITWLANIEMCTWSSDWGMTLYYGDSEDSQDEAFPRLAGFFRMHGYPRQAALLLTECEYCCVSDEAFVDGNDLLALCWMRGGDEGEICPGRHLLELDELTLARLSKEYGGFNNGRFISDAQRIREYAGDHLGISWRDNPLKPMIDSFGYQGVMDILASIKEEERIERDRRLNERIDRDIRRIQLTQGIYDSVAPLSPEQLPHDLTVMELTIEQEQSLRKWMQETLKLRDCIITHGSHYNGSSFIVTFVDDRGRETREFSKDGGCYPGVKEAFRLLFASFYERHQCPVCCARETYWIDYRFDEDGDDGDQDNDLDVLSRPVITEEKYYAGDDVDRFMNEHDRWYVKLWYDEVNTADTSPFEEPLFHCGECGHNWRD